MKAVVWHGRRTSVSRRCPTRRSRSRPTRSSGSPRPGLCGSDLHLYEVMGPFMTEGDILGHEPMGIVEAVGTRRDQHRRSATGW